MTRAAARKPLETQRQRRDTPINIRVPTALRDLIDNAATLTGKTRSDFILESAKKQATDVLLDQRLFTIDEESYGAFVRALNAPPASNAKLKQLFRSRAPWEE